MFDVVIVFHIGEVLKSLFGAGDLVLRREVCRKYSSMMFFHMCNLAFLVFVARL